MMMIIRLFGVKALPVLGFLFQGRIAQRGKVNVEERRAAHGESNHKGLVAGVIDFVQHLFHALHLTPGLVRGGAMRHACFETFHTAAGLVVFEDCGGRVAKKATMGFVSFLVRQIKKFVPPPPPPTNLRSINSLALGISAHMAFK